MFNACRRLVPLAIGAVGYQIVNSNPSSTDLNASKIPQFFSRFMTSCDDKWERPRRIEGGPNGKVWINKTEILWSYDHGHKMASANLISRRLIAEKAELLTKIKGDSILYKSGVKGSTMFELLSADLRNDPEVIAASGLSLIQRIEIENRITGTTLFERVCSALTSVR